GRIGKGRELARRLVGVDVGVDDEDVVEGERGRITRGRLDCHAAFLRDFFGNGGKPWLAGLPRLLLHRVWAARKPQSTFSPVQGLATETTERYARSAVRTTQGLGPAR